MTHVYKLAKRYRFSFCFSFGTETKSVANPNVLKVTAAVEIPPICQILVLKQKQVVISA